MRKFILFLAIVILAGCSPTRRLARLLDRFPLPADTLIEYRDTIIYRDSIIFEQIPGDTVWRDTIIPVEVDIPDTELKTASTYSEATAWILDNRLGLELIQYDTILQFILDSVKVHQIDTVYVEVIKDIPTSVNPNPFYKNGFFVLVGLIVLTLFLFFLIGRK